jgi:hypothetical protein
MAALPLHLLLLLPLLAAVSFWWLNRAASRRRGGGARLPPSPWALPVIGHLHHLAGALPHRAMRDLAARHGPLMLLRLGGLPVVVASSADAAREVMRARDLDFATRPVTRMVRLAIPAGAEGIIFAPYGEGWRQIRKICTVELLSARRVQSFRPVREEEAGRLLRAAASASATPPRAVNLSELLSVYAADSSVRAIIGSRFKDRDTFLGMLERGLKLFAKMSLPDLFPSSRLAMLVSRMPGRMKRHRQEAVAFMDALIREHEESRASDDGKEDLLDVLLRIQREGDLQVPLTTDNIKSVVGVSTRALKSQTNKHRPWCFFFFFFLRVDHGVFSVMQSNEIWLRVCRAGHVRRRQRDGCDDAAMDHGRAHEEPESDAEGARRGPASTCRTGYSNRG